MPQFFLASCTRLILRRRFPQADLRCMLAEQEAVTRIIALPANLEQAPLFLRNPGKSAKGGGTRTQ